MPVDAVDRIGLSVKVQNERIKLTVIHNMEWVSQDTCEKQSVLPSWVRQEVYYKNNLSAIFGFTSIISPFMAILCDILVFYSFGFFIPFVKFSLKYFFSSSSSKICFLNRFFHVSMSYPYTKIRSDPALTVNFSCEVNCLALRLIHRIPYTVRECYQVGKFWI